MGFTKHVFAFDSLGHTRSFVRIIAEVPHFKGVDKFRQNLDTENGPFKLKPFKTVTIEPGFIVMKDVIPSTVLKTVRAVSPLSTVTISSIYNL